MLRSMTLVLGHFTGFGNVQIRQHHIMEAIATSTSTALAISESHCRYLKPTNKHPAGST